MVYNIFTAYRNFNSKSKKYLMDHVRLVLQVSEENQLYINLKNCTFSTNKLLFLGFFC